MCYSDTNERRAALDDSFLVQFGASLSRDWGVGGGGEWGGGWGGVWGGGVSDSEPHRRTVYFLAELLLLESAPVGAAKPEKHENSVCIGANLGGVGGHGEGASRHRSASCQIFVS